MKGEDFRPGQGSSASSLSPAGVHGSADGPGERFFALFSTQKMSAKIGPHSGSELSADFTSSTPAAHVNSLAVVALLDHFKQGGSSDIDMLYRLITEARHRLQQLEAWADEVAGDDDGPG